MVGISYNNATVIKSVHKSTILSMKNKCTWLVHNSTTRSTGLREPVPRFLMKNSLSAFLLIRSIASVTFDKDYRKSKKQHGDVRETGGESVRL